MFEKSVLRRIFGSMLVEITVIPDRPMIKVIKLRRMRWANT
jgi:hypothetical protein